jgi:hypothetical protein
MKWSNAMAPPGVVVRGILGTLMASLEVRIARHRRRIVVDQLIRVKRQRFTDLPIVFENRFNSGSGSPSS